MANLYALVELAQSALIKQICFGTCGRVSAAGTIATEQFGPLWVCTHQQCPHERAHTKTPIGRSTWTDEPVFLRSIQPQSV